jgi:deazaflavin-dependent oxidoreductase (nitroreductase family)
MLEDVADADNAYLTTTGRRTGAPHEIEIWFATDGTTIWMISGGRDRSDWVRNLLAAPAARIRIAGETYAVVARPDLGDPAERRTAAETLHAKYADRVGATAEEWVADAYLVAFDPS